MRKIIFIFTVMFNLLSNGQEKNNEFYYDKLKEVEGTDYVIGFHFSRYIVNDSNFSSLIFINTKTGKKNQVDFPKDTRVGMPEQIKIDSLNINLIFVRVNSLEQNANNKSYNINPSQIIILSTDGKTKTQLTDNDFFVKHLTYNKNTGTMVVSGYYDKNKNNKFDEQDNSDIILYNLKTLKRIN
ncbi:hypothetical protein G6N05_14805 [Flavobacterium sp. F372]|jgi:hypothetical protein|uniref:Uncharacterized protein n=1 Tax=Flavobacterium bernardetii TaxID=2813823 RepID=A0ABR7IZL6_9FLAO|nr:hypothetical protein [Flavobacterium bernardetii]MBC5835229.1 hypothetical protein [Flavobacterium bernardetii]NHF71382.1 hypothetical protein [Flavobacterium bernardetii]